MDDDNNLDTYDEAGVYQVPIDQDVETARNFARARCDEDAAMKRREVDTKINSIVSLKGDADMVRRQALNAIDDAATRARLGLEVANYENDERVQKRQLLLSVARDRIIPQDAQCQTEHADGTICGRPLKKNQLECRTCRASTLRKPSNMHPNEWERVKALRAQQRREQSNARKQRNQAAKKRLLLSKGLKPIQRKPLPRAPRPPADQTSQQVQAQQFVPFAQNSMQMSELVKAMPQPSMCPVCQKALTEHFHTCDSCKAPMCHAAECITGHKHECTGAAAMDTAN